MTRMLPNVLSRQRIVLVAVIPFLSSQALHAAEGAEIHFDQLKGDALKAVLQPIPPKEPAEALRCLEVIKGF